jgi:hypothetical protein
MMNATIDDRATVAPPQGGSTARRVLAGVLVPVITVAIAVVGLRASAPGGIPALQAVAFGLVLVGAVSGAVLARTSHRVALWQVAFGALVAAVALTAARIGDDPANGQHGLARHVATLGVPLLIAISFHMLLALPDGRLGGRGRQAGAALAYAAAAAAGVALAIAGRPFPAAAAAAAWPLVAAR